MMSYKAMASFLAWLALCSIPNVHSFQSRSQMYHTHSPSSALRLSSPSITYSRPSRTSTSYSNDTDPPFSSNEGAGKPSFASRLRTAALKTEQQKVQKKSSLVQEVTTLQDYKKVVADEKDRLVVVRFYAKWCRACKAMEPYFYKLAAAYPNVKFVEVPVLESNANLHQGLGVPSLPFGHIYSPSAGLVEELKISKKHFKEFKNVLDTYANGECSLTP